MNFSKRRTPIGMGFDYTNKFPGVLSCHLRNFFPLPPLDCGNFLCRVNNEGRFVSFAAKEQGRRDNRFQKEAFERHLTDNLVSTVDLSKVTTPERKLKPKVNTLPGHDIVSRKTMKTRGHRDLSPYSAYLHGRRGRE